MRPSSLLPLAPPLSHGSSRARTSRLRSKEMVDASCSLERRLQRTHAPLLPTSIIFPFLLLLLSPLESSALSVHLLDSTSLATRQIRHAVASLLRVLVLLATSRPVGTLPHSLELILSSHPLSLSLRIRQTHRGTRSQPFPDSAYAAVGAFLARATHA